jgi:cellobiose-specific phosphotransferase system component IIA
MAMYRKRLVEAELQLSDALYELERGDRKAAEAHVTAAITRVRRAHETWLETVRANDRDDEDSAAD